MKNALLTTMFLLLFAGFTLAQSTSSSNPASGGTSSTQDQMSQPSTTPHDMSPQTSDKDQMGKSTTAENKGENKGKEKSVTGCLASAGSSGQYTINHKNKDITVVPSS